MLEQISFISVIKSNENQKQKNVQINQEIEINEEQKKFLLDLIDKYDINDDDIYKNMYGSAKENAIKALEVLDNRNVNYGYRNALDFLNDFSSSLGCVASNFSQDINTPINRKYFQISDLIFELRTYVEDNIDNVNFPKGVVKQLKATLKDVILMLQNCVDYKNLLVEISKNTNYEKDEADQIVTNFIKVDIKYINKDCVNEICEAEITKLGTFVQYLKECLGNKSEKVNYLKEKLDEVIKNKDYAIIIEITEFLREFSIQMVKENNGTALKPLEKLRKEFFKVMFNDFKDHLEKPINNRSFDDFKDNLEKR